MIRSSPSTWTRSSPMIALPFHPSNAYTIHEFLDNAKEILREGGAGCCRAASPRRTCQADRQDARRRRLGGSGRDRGLQPAACSTTSPRRPTFSRGSSTGNGEFSLDVYPTSRARVARAHARSARRRQLLESGAVIKPSFCGPCFGAGDVPANNGLSLRHTTRNFPNREGSKPGEGQFAGVCLMDARSIAATAANGGTHHRRDGHGLRSPCPTTYHFDKCGLRQPCLLRLRQGRSLAWSSSWVRTSPTGRRCTR